MKLLERLVSVLEQKAEFVVDGQLLKNKIIESAIKADVEMLALLAADVKLKSIFFSDIGSGMVVFDKDKLIKFVSSKEFLPDSYTAFKNKVGLSSNGEYLKADKDVVLVWPYKDCVLEGGQSREDAKTNEIFWNETLASDETNLLLKPKAFTGFKRLEIRELEITNGDSHIDETTDFKLQPTDNLIIKGNNLLALYSLKERFKGQIKLIYIDPPYNTGNDGFKYNDSFNHASWLTFMKNRLEVARDLLKNDGVIFVSIDDNEQAYLKVLMDDVMGKDHYITTIVTQNNPKGRVMDKHFSISHEYILVYSKKPMSEELSIKKTEAEVNKNYQEEDANGKFRLLELRNTHKQFGKHNRPNLFFAIYVNPEDFTISTTKSEKYTIKVEPIWDDGFDGCWTWGANKCEIESEMLTAKQVNGKWKIYRKSYANDSDGNFVSKKLKTIWLSKDFHTEKGQKLLTQMFGENVFYAPKPLELIKTIIDLATDKDANDIVLDFHAGSGTTGHAVLDINKEDGGNRKFILVEQMDYIKTITTERVKKVMDINKEGSFVYCELMQLNSKYIDQIEEASTSDQLKTILNDILSDGYIKYKVDPEVCNVEFDLIKDMTGQKLALIDILDKNYLYINYSEIDDATNEVSEQDKVLNQQFYGETK